MPREKPQPQSATEKRHQKRLEREAKKQTAALKALARLTERRIDRPDLAPTAVPVEAVPKRDDS